jgi:hypothetical protein
VGTIKQATGNNQALQAHNWQQPSSSSTQLATTKLFKHTNGNNQARQAHNLQQPSSSSTTGNNQDLQAHNLQQPSSSVNANTLILRTDRVENNLSVLRDVSAQSFR